MRRFMLFIGMGYALLSANACRARPDSPLAAASARNDVDAVRRLLAGGHPPDEAGDRWTPLMWAAREGATEAMAILLDHGASVDARDRANQWTPLLHAVHTSRPAAVRLLLTRGADPNIGTPNGLTPLLMAADASPTIVTLLLSHGANPRAADEWGRTPLTQAVSGGALGDIDRPILGGCQPAIVRALLAHDPTLRLPDTFAGHQALWWARFHDCRDVLELLGKNKPWNAAKQIISGVEIAGEVLQDQLKPRDAAPRSPATADRSRP